VRNRLFKEIIMSHIPHIRRIAAALAGLACACLGLAITASAAFAQVLQSPGDGGMPTALVREALLHGEDLAPMSGSGSVPSFGAVTRTVVVGGMPGWWIALIAAGAALPTAMLAVLAGYGPRTTRPPRRPESGQAGLGQRRRDGNESTPGRARLVIYGIVPT
jgi:hypothetical protein